MIHGFVQRWLYRPAPGCLAKAMACGTTWVSQARGHRPRPRAPAIPTLVVGSLSVGGAGKTPVTRWLAERLDRGGRRVAVVCRGYRGQSVDWARVESPSSKRYGDEGSELRRRLPKSVAVLVGHDRVAALAHAWSGSDVVIVDDGFQDPALPRSADIVVMDATAPYGVMPAGPLREPLSALERADLVWLHKIDEVGARRLPAGLEAAVMSAIEVTAVRCPGGERLNPRWLRGRVVNSLCAIGRPRSFRATLERHGALIATAVERSDHSVFRKGELERVFAEGRPVVTTAKDAERIPRRWSPHVVETDVQVRVGHEAIDGMLRRVGAV